MGTSARAFRICVALVALTMSTGCTVKTMMRDYAPTLPPSSFPALAGKTVCLSGIQKAFTYDEDAKVPATPKDEPPNYKYVEVTDAEKDRWSDDFSKAKSDVPESQRMQIGVTRNLVGAASNTIVSLTDPAKYFTEVLAFDLQAQGARVLNQCTAAQADLTVGGKMTFFAEDAYGAAWTDVVTEIQIANRAGPVLQRAFHVHGENSFLFDVEFELYRPARESAQRLSRLVIAELQRAASGAPSAAPVGAAPAGPAPAPAPTTAAPAVPATASAPAAPGSCQSDSDCKAGRICRAAKCEPPPKAATPPPPPPAGQCAKDTDCKGERICNAGQCMPPKH